MVLDFVPARRHIVCPLDLLGLVLFSTGALVHPIGTARPIYPVGVIHVTKIPRRATQNIKKEMVCTSLAEAEELREEPKAKDVEQYGVLKKNLGSAESGDMPREAPHIAGQGGGGWVQGVSSRRA